MSVQTDISSLVDEAFASLECAWRSDDNHGGATVALVSYHGCAEGIVCESHYRALLDELPAIAARIARGDDCIACHRRFPNLESYVKVFPI